jgi:hypothetical protein
MKHFLQENAIYEPATEVLENAGWQGFQALQSLSKGASQPIYEIRRYILASGSSTKFFLAMAGGIKERCSVPDAGTLVFVGQCEMGQKMTVAVIWRYSSAQNRKEARDKVKGLNTWVSSMKDTAPLVLESSVEIVQPTGFSPMQ